MEEQSTSKEQIQAAGQLVTAAESTVPLVQQATRLVGQEAGYELRLDEIRFRQIGLTWGYYTNPVEKRTTFHPLQTTVVSHFRLAEPPRTRGQFTEGLAPNQFVVYREPDQAYELVLPPTTEQPRRFFELSLGEDFFTALYTDESAFLKGFPTNSFLPLPSLAYASWMHPAMHDLIRQMQQSPYQGYLKGVYLEAKAVELFLLQVSQFDRLSASQPLSLSTRDIACLHAVKEHLDRHYEQPGSILELSRLVGINQMKLKSGFKTLFNTTVFGYLTQIRMQLAKRLLVDEGLTVQEVAERVGYKHGHHFSIAFKRMYGVLPTELKLLITSSFRGKIH